MEETVEQKRNSRVEEKLKQIHLIQICNQMIAMRDHHLQRMEAKIVE